MDQLRTHSLPINLLRESFFGPWVPIPGKKGRVRHHHMSLAHWFECQKFMPARPDLRDSILCCPSVKEARKFSKARQQHWRSDWNLIRHLVLTSGLGFLTLDRPDLGLNKEMSVELLDSLLETKLPPRFLEQCIDRYKVWLDGPHIGTYGANTAPEGVVGRKMAKTVQAKPSWTLVSLCNKNASWRLHDWALAQHVPIQYIGTEVSRLTNSLIEQLVQESTQMVVFEVKGGNGSDSVIARSRATKTPVSLELYRPEDLDTSSLI